MGKIEMDEEVKAILREAFGDSSSDSDGSDDQPRRLQVDDTSDETLNTLSISGVSLIWQPIVEINGLWICRDFLSLHQQSSLLSTLEKEEYFAGGLHNQAMRFGDLPSWAIELSLYIRENVPGLGHIPESTHDSHIVNCLFPEELLWREPLFNQLIVNIYQPGEGICAHVDLMRFEDGIAIISLESSCVMHFGPVKVEAEEEVNKIPVLLTPGSIILMWGEARYLWKHEINRKPGFQIWDGQDIDQKRRTSITLRRLCQTD